MHSAPRSFDAFARAGVNQIVSALLEKKQLALPCTLASAQVVTVNSLTSSTLNISFIMEEEVDLDDDPETPDVTVTFNQMTLSLSKQM